MRMHTIGKLGQKEGFPSQDQQSSRSVKINQHAPCILLYQQKSIYRGVFK